MVPGAIIIVPLIFSVALLKNGYQTLKTPLIAGVVAFGPVAGFFVHQLYMLCNDAFLLKNPIRPVIKSIMEFSGRKLQNKEKTLKTTSDEAFLAWHYFFYESKKIDNYLNNYILRCWHFIHSFSSIFLAFIIGDVLLFILVRNLKTTPCDTVLITNPLFIKIGVCFFVFYFLGILIFFLKALQTWKLVGSIEDLIAFKYKTDIQNILTTILDSHKDKHIK